MSATICKNTPECGYLATCPDRYGCDYCCRCSAAIFCPHGFWLDECLACEDEEDAWSDQA